jgi:hypothetical protein
MFRKVNYDCSLDAIRYMDTMCGRTGGTVEITALLVFSDQSASNVYLPFKENLKLMMFIEEVAHGFHLSHLICLQVEVKSCKLL